MEEGDDKEEFEGYLETAKGYLAEAQEQLDKGDYEDAEEYADKAENKAEFIVRELGGDDDHEEEEEEEKVKICHKGLNKYVSAAALDGHLGHGDTEGACDSDEYHKKDDWKKDKVRDRVRPEFKDYGFSEDREELRAQLRVLLTLLIQLLQAEMLDEL